MQYKDNFSTQAADYARYRPQYPQALFAYLLELVGEHGFLWDCATGNGQVAAQLAPHFGQVLATDASEAQLQHAPAHPNITYQVGKAHQSGLPDHCADLITVGQALHWFAHEDFYQEARRVGKAGSYLVAWGYSLPRISPEVDAVVDVLYKPILGTYWDAERHFVDAHYETLPFPFEELEMPAFEMQIEYDLPAFRQYLSTWSSWQKFVRQHGHSPLQDLEQALAEAWGEAGEAKTVRFPLFFKATRLP